MLKNKLRFLGIGFLLSALLLTGYKLVTTEQAQAAHEREESLLAERDDYKTKYEQMQVDYNVLLSEKQNASKEQDRQLVPFTVEEGQPSSVVLQNLVREGFIANAREAEEHLIENGMLAEIRYGTYTLSKDMKLEEVLAVLTGR